MTLSQTRPSGVRVVTGMQSCAQLPQLPHHGITDTSMLLSDKDGLRGRHSRPEKRRYQHRAIPVSRWCTESLFLAAEGQTYRASRVKRVYVETSRYIE